VPCASRVSRALAPQATPAQRRGRHHSRQSSQHFPAISPVIRRLTEIIAFLALPQRGRAVISYSFGSIQRGHGHPWRDGLGLDPGPQACNECPVMQTGPRLTRSQDIPDQVIDLPTVPGLFVTTDLPDDRAKRSPSSCPSASADICSRSVSRSSVIISSLVCPLNHRPSPPFATLVFQHGPNPGRNRLARPENPRTDRANRTSHDFGDFLIAQPVDLAQGHRLP
jgi:hypothetical protein